MYVKNASGKCCRCTRVYRHPKANEKKHTWTLLRRLVGLSSLSWLCFGDFNKILNPNEKIRGVDRNANLIAEFRDVVLDCKLIDLGSKGHPFTWCNRKFRPFCIEEKLDRFFCNEECRTEFHDDAATNLIHWEFDHCPIMMEVRERQRSLVYEIRNFNRIYYEDMWSSYEE